MFRAADGSMCGPPVDVPRAQRDRAMPPAERKEDQSWRMLIVAKLARRRSRRPPPNVRYVGTWDAVHLVVIAATAVGMVLNVRCKTTGAGESRAFIQGSKRRLPRLRSHKTERRGYEGTQGLCDLSGVVRFICSRLGRQKIFSKLARNWVNTDLIRATASARPLRPPATVRRSKRRNNAGIVRSLLATGSRI
jgi:hypothetical protein